MWCGKAYPPGQLLHVCVTYSPLPVLQCDSPAVFVLNSTANLEVTYLFLHSNHHPGISHAISTDSSSDLPNLNPVTHTLNACTSTSAYLTPPPSVCPRSEEIKGTYENTLFRVITRFLSTRVLQVLHTGRSHTHIFCPHNVLLDSFQWRRRIEKYTRADL